MRHYATTYQPEDRSSPVADLLELIARKAPLFMRCGGGNVHGEGVRPLSDEEKARITSLSPGRTVREVAALTQHSETTVRRVLRGGGR